MASLARRPAPDLDLAYRTPYGSEGGPYLPHLATVFSSGPLHYSPNTWDSPITPSPLGQYSELNFVTRFIATASFDVIGGIGNDSDIVLTVKPNGSISFDRDINLGSMSVVDSFIIDSSGNTDVTRAVDGGVSVAGRPLTIGGKRVAEQFAGWKIVEAETIDGENVVFARHCNGVTHLLAADANWGLTGFSGVSNLESVKLRPEARFSSGVSLLPLASVGDLALARDVGGHLFIDGEPVTQDGRHVTYSSVPDYRPTLAATNPVSDPGLDGRPWRILLWTDNSGNITAWGLNGANELEGAPDSDLSRDQDFDIPALNEVWQGWMSDIFGDR